MLSYHLFRQSFRQIATQRRAAAVILFPALVVNALVGILPALAGPVTQDDYWWQMPLSLLGMVLWAFVSLRWHRVVLQGDPASAWHSNRLLPYVGRSMQLTACGVGVMLIVYGALALARSSTMTTVAISLALVLLWVWGWRLSVMFPAVALGRGMGPVAAWRHTRGSTGTVVVMTLFIALALVAMMVVFALVGIAVSFIPPEMAMAWLLGDAATGLIALIGSGGIWLLLIGLQASLYAHYVEGRALV